MSGKKKTNNKPTVNSVKTVTSVKKQNAFETVLTNIICILVFIAFGYIAVMSFIQTSSLDPTAYASEKILFNTDNLVLNTFFTVIFTVFIFKMKRHYDFFAKINIKYIEIGLVAYTVLLSLIWVLSASSIPAADSYNIYETAVGAVNGNFTSFTNNPSNYNSAMYDSYSYFQFYPFQLGIVFISEIIYRIFGTSTAMPIEVINTICLGFAYLGIAKLTRLIFKKRSIEFITILLLAGCFQPMLFTSFAYGNIIGMCCGIWASYFLIKYLQTNKYTLIIPCGVLLVLATLAKYNNMIYLVAFAIVLIVHTVKEKKWQSVAFALALCIATVGVNSIIIKSYEARSGVDLGDGISQTLYLDMGINESYMAPGWYNGIALDTYKRANFDSQLANAIAKSDINNRLNTFGNDFDYTIDFFGKKIVSQWNEPTFESIWVSKVKDHYYDINGIAKAVYEGSTGQFFELYFNFYMQILYILFTVGIYLLIIRKKSNIETILLPLIILGGFGYHLLFEGKSQYILTYIILLIPTASFALNVVINGKYTAIKNFINKIKEIPQK